MAVASIFGGIGDFEESQGEQEAAQLFGEEATVGQQELKYEKASTAIQQTAAQRQIYQASGQNVAGAAAGNLSESGSALNVLRMTKQQGAIQQQLIGTQGEINEAGTQMQIYSAQASQDQANATANAETMAGVGGILGGLGTLAMAVL